MIEGIKNISQVEKPSNIVDLLRAEIETAPEKIKDELTRSQNSWLSCFKTRAYAIGGLLFLIKSRNLLPEDVILKAEGILKNIGDNVEEIKGQYGDLPPSNEQQYNLLSKLTEMLTILDLESKRKV